MPQIFPVMILACLVLMSGCVSKSTYEQSVKQYQQQLDNTRLLVGLFAVGSVITLFIGTAMGSKARKDAYK